VFRDLGLEYIPKHTIHMEKYYMRQPMGVYMGLNTSVKQIVEKKMLNDLNRYLLFFLNKILDQAKAPEWHEAMVNANIDMFEISYEASVSYVKNLENLEKIRHTNNPNTSSLPVDKEKRVFVNRSVGNSKNHKGSNM
jgi:hypothetical protein